jgi:hypothetical protein
MEQLVADRGYGRFQPTENYKWIETCVTVPFGVYSADSNLHPFFFEALDLLVGKRSTACRVGPQTAWRKFNMMRSR